jgi:hypothetical protein
MTPNEAKELDHAMVSLKDYLDVRIEDVRSMVESRLIEINRAVTKSDVAIEQRFQSVNELRAMANDIANRGMTRAEFNSAHSALEDKIDNVQRLTYIGFGIAIAMQIAFGAAVLLWRGHTG